MSRVHPWRVGVLTVAGLCAALAVGPLFAASPDKAGRYYEDAQARFDRADYPGAVLQLKNALQQDDRMLAAHVLLGRAMLAEGDSAGAEGALRKALDLGVDRGEILSLLAKAMYGQGKYKEVLALEMPSSLPRKARIEMLVLRGAACGEQGDAIGAGRNFDEARALDPKSVAVLLADAAQQLRVGKLDRAEELAKQALASEPGNADAWALRASLFAARRQLDPAVDAFARALGLNPRHVDARLGRINILVELNRDAEALAELETLKVYAPQDPRAAYMRGVLAARRDDSAGVTREMGEVVRVIDAIPPVIRNHRPNMLLLGAMAHYSLRNFQKAQGDFENLLRLQPDHVGSIRLLASIYLMQGDGHRAVGILEPYVRKAPTDSQALSLLASAYMAEKKYAQASALLQQVVQGPGKDAALQTALGVSLAGQGEAQLALPHLRSAFEASGGTSAAGTALAVLLLQRDDAKGAVAVMDKVVAREPRNLTAHNLLGLARAQAGDRAGARAAYERALALDARFVPASLNLARLDSAEGASAAARKRLLAVLQAQPNHADALMDLADIDLNEGRFDTARAGMEKALAVARRNPRPALVLSDTWLARGEPGKALEVARSALAAMPDNVHINMAVARAQMASSDVARARDTLNNARKLAGFDATALVAIARLQLQADHLQGAQYSVEKAISAQPNYFPAQVLQAELALLAKDMVGADKLGKRLAEQYPNRAIGLHIQGDVALAQGQKANALTLHRAALARERNTESVLRVFRAHAAAGDPAKGLAVLREFAVSQPNDMRLQGALAEAQMQAGDWKSARASLEGLIKRSGEQAPLLNNLALVLLQLNDPQAASVAERAWKLAPNDPILIDTLGWVLVHQGQGDRGLRMLRDARLRDARNPEVRYHLAWALAKAGRPKEAREELAPILGESARFDSREAARQLAAELGL